MGVITSGILGGFSGKVGPVVGGSWKGISYMRQLPASVANPNTAGQQAQRTKLSNIVAFARAVLSAVIKPLNDRFAEHMSGYNLFVQRNIGLFTLGYPDVGADLELSTGSLLGVDDFAATEGSTVQKFDGDWTDNSGTGNASATDEVYMIGQNRTTGEVIAAPAGTVRSDATITGVFTETCTSADLIMVWAAFRKANGFIASNTEYSTYNVA